jgi:hypothetical protein
MALAIKNIYFSCEPDGKVKQFARGFFYRIALERRGKAGQTIGTKLELS